MQKSECRTQNGNTCLPFCVLHSDFCVKSSPFRQQRSAGDGDVLASDDVEGARGFDQSHVAAIRNLDLSNLNDPRCDSSADGHIRILPSRYYSEVSAAIIVPTRRKWLGTAIL